MAELTNEVAASGQALAAFMGELGESVAKGQSLLDRNTGQVAADLSKVLVKIPAVIQEKFDDDGNPTSVNIVNNEVPMSTIILPVAYQFSRVFFQADLNLSELDEKKGIRLVKNAAALRGEGKVNADITALATGTLPGITAGASVSASQSDQNRTTKSSTDQAVAVLHFEATLEPRREVQVPTPTRLRIAPRVTVAVTKLTLTPMTASVPAAGGAGAVAYAPEKRVAEVSIMVFRADGTDVTGAALAKIQYSADATDLVITKGAALAGTSIVLTITRTQGGEQDPLPPRAPTMLRVTLGSITEQISLSI
ncbi:MAG: hypothetical protein AMXMBFR47_32270 [Planctomycetota bacterium]